MTELQDENTRLRGELEAENAKLKAALEEARAATTGATGLDDEGVRRLEHPEEFTGTGGDETA